jgi:hypothetical protein
MEKKEFHVGSDTRGVKRFAESRMERAGQAEGSLAPNKRAGDQPGAPGGQDDAGGGAEPETNSESAAIQKMFMTPATKRRLFRSQK